MVQVGTYFQEAFEKPWQAAWVVIATIFVLAMLFMDSFVDPTSVKLIVAFSGVLAVVIGTGFLARGTRAMMNGRKPFALLIGTCGLLIFGVGIIEILVAGATDIAKELAGMVGAGILGFFIDDDS